jgi:GH15 family glucan-1,4-alpha-glucosidase
VADDSLQHPAKSALQRMIGNFPQAFSHVALMNTAHNLAHAKKPAAQRAT